MLGAALWWRLRGFVLQRWGPSSACLCLHAPPCKPSVHGVQRGGVSRPAGAWHATARRRGRSLATACAARPAVVTKVADDELYIVVNAGCRDKDLAHIGKHLEAYKVRHQTRPPTTTHLNLFHPLPTLTPPHPHTSPKACLRLD